MWEFLSKVALAILEKVSFITMFIFLSIFLLIWVLIPYEFVASIFMPRELPVGLFFVFLFVISSGIFILIKGGYDYLFPRYKQRKAFDNWDNMYSSLSQGEIEIINKFVSQYPATLRLQRNEAMPLIVKGIVQVKFFNPIVKEYSLTPSFSHFIFNKYQQEFFKNNKSL